MNHMDGGEDKTRRKRLKVVSACGECRRKKTKCNGENPCAGCLKAHVECKYVSQQQQKPHTLKAPSPSSSSTASTTPSIESIEERLEAIESILRQLIGNGKNSYLLDSLPPLKRRHEESSIPSIKNLLNHHHEEWPRSSAFFRPTKLP